MGGSRGKKKLVDPEAEAWPARAGSLPKKKERRWGRACAALTVCLMTLPFLVFFFLGGWVGASAGWQNAAKLTAGSGGLLNNSLPSATGASATNVDELFGGLLATGFNRRACLSRHESPQYYKHSPHAPSFYLLHKLRNYEARHKKCSPGTPLYTKSVEQLQTGRTMEVMECKYLVWLPYNGLGNRMLSLLSTFLYALLTDRVLLVDSTDDFTDLFCEPFLGATWVLPPDFPVANLTKLGVNSDQSYGNLLGKKKKKNDPAKATVQSMPPYVYLHLSHDLKGTDGLFFCSDDQLVLAKLNWLLLQSDHYFVPLLYSIAEFHDELQLLFPSKESVSHLLGRYLFHPTNKVWGLVTRYYHSYLAQAEERIGVQVRMFNWASIPIDDMYKQILACSRQEHILPEIDDDKAGTNGAVAAVSKAILIASLQADYYERMKSMYYEHTTNGGERVGVFQPSHEGRQTMGQRWHNQKALAEIYLLSFSDVLLTTGMSTFGYVCSSLAGLRPTMLLTANGHKVAKTPCVRAMSMEPCFHHPPDVKCQGKTVDKEEQSPHVKVCEDATHGIKLID